MLKKIGIVVWRTIKILFEWIFISLFMFVLYLSMVIPIDPPHIEDMSSMELEVEEENGIRFIENSWMRLNSAGLYEVYIEGDPFERGVKYGKLIYEQNEIQEGTFVSQIEEIVPNDVARFFIKIFVGWFNRDLDEEIPEEFLKELYGLSFYMSDKYDYVASKFYRILNYHAAHDIGHALKGMHMVGCTSFALNNSKSEKGDLLIGRNFDFYVGKEFAKQKMLHIIKPIHGYGFVSYAWPGMLGVVSGMNEHGLTVTLNASKSNLPTGAKVPISILAREILQYAKTIAEAYEIAKKRDVFVSESLLIGSALDKRAAIIEKTPEGFDLYDPNKDVLICSNHFQSESFFDTEINQENIEQSDSKYRYQRTEELIKRIPVFTPKDVGTLLRDYKGIKDEFIGYGNPKSINQFIANHSVVFQPEKKLVWISTDHFQMGGFICYDLNLLFGNSPLKSNAILLIDSLKIERDSFVNSIAFKNYLKFKDLKEMILMSITMDLSIKLKESEINSFINWNPESYVTYMTLGEYFDYNGEVDRALEMFLVAKSKSVASLEEEQKIQDYINAIQFRSK